MSTRTTSTQCSPVSVKVKRCVSVLPNDYSQLENMPTINGVTLIGDLKANELGVLSSNKNDYETLSVLNPFPREVPPEPACSKNSSSETFDTLPSPRTTTKLSFIS